MTPNDLFLFCSNGLSDVLDGDHMRELLAGCNSLQEACDALLHAARRSGAEDDATVAMVRPTGVPVPEH